MSESKIEKMSNAARDPIVALMKYNKLRGRVKDGLVFVFEGSDDPIFYSIAADRSGFSEKYSSLVVDGKDMVLGLRKLLTESIEAEKGGGVAFFADSDFDGLKGHSMGKDIYITPAYSIENIVCTVESLQSLLNLEFKLIKEDQHEDIEKISIIYNETLEDFQKKIRDVNLLIFFGRTASKSVCGSRLKRINDKSDAFFTLNKNTLQITSKCEGEKSKDVVQFDLDFELSKIEIVRSDFEKLNPTTQWRGKFYFSFFTQLIQALVEDKNSINPKFFSKGKGKVKLNLSTDSAFRILSTACKIPQCLPTFFAGLPMNALH